MNKRAIAFVFLFFVVLTVSARAQTDVTTDIRNATEVLKKFLVEPNGIPTSQLDLARCVLVCPRGKAGAFEFGAAHRSCVLECRTTGAMTGDWAGPIIYSLTSDSPTFQQYSGDLVLLVTGERTAQKLISGEFTLGRDTRIVSGTEHQTAEYNEADILSYTQTNGLFAGASLGKATLKTDDEANRMLYGKQVAGPSEILNQRVKVPSAAKPLIQLLNARSPKRN